MRRDKIVLMNYNNLCPHCMRDLGENRQLICPYCGHDFKKITEITHHLRPFTILCGKYLVGDVLGEGGFGITYIGFDLNLEIKTAIKEFYPNGYCSRESMTTTKVTSYQGSNAEVYDKWRENFVREAKILAKFSHLPGIVDVKDFFQENNTAYIVMEYLEGITLKNYIKQQGGKLPVEQVIATLELPMLSLAQMHKAGLIHRDISPDNIMLTANGDMKLLDFGAAREYTAEDQKSLSVMLKPGYAPEEQYRTKGKQGPWSDVYAFAATVYKCITGVTPIESMERLRQDDLKKPRELGVNISAQTEAALLKGMSVYAENRYQSMEELHRGLAAGLGKEQDIPINAQVVNTPQKSETMRNAATTQTTPKKKGKIGSYAVAAGLAVCLFFAIVLIFEGRSSSDESIPAQTPKAETAVAEAVKIEPEEESAEEEEIVSELQPDNKEINTYEYEFLIDDVTWHEAYNACIARGGHLVTIETQEEFEILTQQLMDQGYDNKIFWMGGLRMPESSEYHWIDAEGNLGDISINSEEEFQDYWLPGEPSYVSENIEEQYIMFFYKSDLERWVWNDAPDDLVAVAANYAGKVGYICEY